MGDIRDKFAEGAGLVADALNERFGEMCETYDPDCPTCKAWLTYGGMVGTVLRHINGHDKTAILASPGDILPATKDRPECVVVETVRLAVIQEAILDSDEAGALAMLQSLRKETE